MYIKNQLIIFVVENYLNMITYPNAKINIGLNIKSKRNDGYHNISSVFYPLKDYYDILEITKSPVFLFSSSGIKIPKGENLCEKAFKLIEANFSISPVHIHLHKRIPIGAGLGGGSSDASFTLKGLNRLFNLNISNLELEKLSLKLGADCPFFIQNSPKYVEGIGDKFTNISLDLSDYNIKLIYSDIHVSTEQAYNSVVINSSKSLILDDILKPISEWKDTIKNDFESTIFNSYPLLENIKNDLYKKGAIYASMSGTGSVVYGLFSKE